MAEYTEAIRSSLEHGGWWPDIVDDDDLRAMVAYLTDLAVSYPIGAVLERRLDAVARRRPIDGGREASESRRSA